MTTGDRARPVLADIQLLRCTTAEELDRSRAFRDHVFQSRRNVALSDRLERRRDGRGAVLLLLHGGDPVATARVGPFPSDVSPLTSLGAPLRDTGADTEVGRVAAVRSPEAARYSLILLTLGSLWVLASTWHRRYVAYCHPRLLPLYELVGARTVGEPCPVPGRDDLHHVIVGEFETSARAGLRLLGTTAAEAHGAIRWYPPPLADAVAPTVDRASA
jgi:hypothetical protein